MRITAFICSLIFAGCVSIALAAAPGNAEAGRQLVMRSCSSCHATETAKTASDNAPPFAAVAKTNRDNPAWIRGWLKNPHPPMPNISLSRQQIDDIVAYLSSLPMD
jgi:mono/diheme cytochrome c family protein